MEKISGIVSSSARVPASDSQASARPGAPTLGRSQANLAKQDVAIVSDLETRFFKPERGETPDELTPKGTYLDREA